MDYNVHYEIERRARREFIAKTIGFGEPIATVFYTSKTSKKERINVLSDTGVVNVYTKEWKPVTVYIATYPQAVIIYRKGTNSEPSEILKNNFRKADHYKTIEP